MGLPELQAKWSTDGSARQAEIDVRERHNRLGEEFRQIVDRFLAGETSAAEFCREVDSFGKHTKYAGFHGIAGQMFFNMLVKAADEVELADALRQALPAPAVEADAERKLTEFLAFVDKTRTRADEIGVKRPAHGYAPYFLSVFWEAEGGEEWPIYYPASRAMLVAHGLFSEEGPLPERYLSFRRQMLDLNRELGTDGYGLQHFLWQLNQEVTNDGELEAHPSASSALHLVVKWSARRHPETIELHRAVADEHGSVWWGLATTSSDDWHISEQWLERLRDQIAAETPTHVFLVGETCWKTDLRWVTYSRDETDESLIPPYYADQEPTKYHLWVQLANFTETDRDTMLRELDPERLQRRGKPVALGNQTNPLLVRMRTEPRVWWVNQGSSYSRAREGGYLWAPLRDKVGNAKGHWETMRHLRPGDVVLNYANTRLRARSEVIAAAVPSARPDPEADRGWEEDGLRAEAQFSELSEPIPLEMIPVEWRRAEGGPFTSDGAVKQGYLFPLSDAFAAKLGGAFPQLDLASDSGATSSPPPPASEMTLEEIAEAVRAEGLEIDDVTLRRYHLSLNTRRSFVILAGVSGTGKTWLAEAYARAAGAKLLVVPVAPNWTTNEDLLGYRNPLDQQYYDTDFSQFLRDADQDHRARGGAAQRFHLVLDEMNLARVEYYFAKFLSAMEQRARADTARIELAPNDTVALPPNLYVTGTVNVDETTHAFAEKVYDRAQLIELPVLRDELERRLIGRPYQALLLTVWDELHPVAPFAYRVVDEINEYASEAEALGVSWEAALDEQLLQKVLPKIKGTDLRVRGALERFIQIAADRFPLSAAKAELMLAAFTEHGFTSYF